MASNKKLSTQNKASSFLIDDKYLYGKYFLDKKNNMEFPVLVFAFLTVDTGQFKTATSFCCC